jgi:hypothetical protein
LRAATILLIGVHHSLGSGTDDRTTNRANRGADRTTGQPNNATCHRTGSGRAAQCRVCFRFQGGVVFSEVVLNALGLALVSGHGTPSLCRLHACSTRAGSHQYTPWGR